MIAAGGTAGHVVPALAVADALRASGAEVEFIGGERAEAELVPAAGYPLHQLKVAGHRPPQPAAGRAALRWPRGAAGRPRGCCAARGADAVLGGGGYVAGPVGLAAALTAHPARALTEADSHLGVANRLLARFARRVCLAFPIAGREGDSTSSPAGRCRPAPARRTGRRPACGFGVAGVGAVPARVRRLARRPPLNRGGARGVRRRGAAAPSCTRPAGATIETCARGSTRSASPPHYRLLEYIEPFADALAAADLVAARAGGSVLELAAAGLPAMLVPYPHATADHQTANARWMERAGAAVVVPDGELDGPRLAREVAALLGTPARLRGMAAAASRISRPDAADLIARETLAAAGPQLSP